MRQRWLLGLVLISTACGDARSVTLEPVDGSGVSGVADLHEALGKSLSYRVDVFVAVDEPSEAMRATVNEGGCATPGAEIKQIPLVHERGEGGAAEVVLDPGRLSDLDGRSIHVHAGEPGTSARLACGEL